MAIDSTCPNCSSKTTQSVAMLVQAGTTTRNTTGVAAGASRGRKGGAVYGSTSTTKSALVARYTPSSKPGYGVAAVALIVGIALLPAGFNGAPVAGVMGAAGVVIGILVARGVPAAQRSWAVKMATLQALWVCKKCGHEWTPQEQ